MEMVLTIMLIEIGNLLAFFIGAMIAQRINNKEKITVPTPTKIIQEYKEHKETQKERKIDQINLDNITNYDGTGYGQKDI